MCYQRNTFQSRFVIQQWQKQTFSGAINNSSCLNRVHVSNLHRVSEGVRYILRFNLSNPNLPSNFVCDERAFRLLYALDNNLRGLDGSMKRLPKFFLKSFSQIYLFSLRFFYSFNLVLFMNSCSFAWFSLNSSFFTLTFCLLNFLRFLLLFAFSIILPFASSPHPNLITLLYNLTCCICTW